ncbi:MAG: TatD family hydrolase [Puniceicoccales bacterium]|jgi:TatD DNase family protein|nr:TatD family hydrolase [Puniceicoccales bacterium]
MEIIDSHCHLDDFFYEGKIEEVLSNAERASVTKMVAVGTNPKDWEFYAEFVRNRKNIFYTVGLHPLEAKSVEDVEQLPNFLEKEIKPVAIGEIGLDYHRLPHEQRAKDETIELQKHIFEKQLEFAKANNLPVVIHSRQAFDDTFNILINSGMSGNRILFHCYGYGVSEMEKLKDFGAFISFAGTLTFKKEQVAPLQAANLDKLLIETDCPYLTPEPHKPSRNEPAFIRATARFAAKMLNMAENDFCSLTYQNTEKFFNLK